MQNNKEKIVAGIVTYNAKPELLLENINAIIEQVDEVIIVDNASHNIEKVKEALIHKEVVWIFNQQNLGIATALNQIMKFAYDNHFEWAITLDQDTIVPPGMVRTLSKYLSKQYGIIAPRHIDRNNKASESGSAQETTLVEWCITSGSLTNVFAWNMIGGFDESLFIDGVDIDYGLRLNKNGYKILKVNSTVISHAVGEANDHYFFGKRISVQNHSAFRKFYISRNILLIAKKNGGPKDIMKAYLRIFKQIGLVILFEKNKREKTKAMLRGMREAMKLKY